MSNLKRENILALNVKLYKLYQKHSRLENEIAEMFAGFIIAADDLQYGLLENYAQRAKALAKEINLN